MAGTGKRKDEGKEDCPHENTTTVQEGNKWVERCSNSACGSLMQSWDIEKTPDDEE